MLLDTVLTWLSVGLTCSAMQAVSIKNIGTTSPSGIADKVHMHNVTNGPGDIFRRTDTSNTLKKRYDFTNSPYTCNGNEVGYASGKYIDKGVNYLYGVKGKPSNEAGKCGRVSCEWNSAIWWCNLSDDTLTLDSFGEIADAVKYLQTKCNLYNDETGINIAGEVRDEEQNWSVVVRKNVC